jgi:TonB family protein
MFTNLIESSSHAKEFKRRGSFVLFTTGTYVVLFVVTGVVSIFAYDARLEEQNLEMVTLISPQEIAPDKSEVPEHSTQPKPTNGEDPGLTHRALAMLSVNHPVVVPECISATPNKNPSLPDSGRVVVDGINKDANGPGTPGANNGGRVVSQPTHIIIPDDPPPAPTPTPITQQVLKLREIINSRALLLPKPPYPPLAKQIRLQGTVVIQVLIDENGKVLSARPVSGHPMLIPEAQRAALQAKFSPTTLNGVAVKVSGMISYNFQMPQ